MRRNRGSKPRVRSWLGVLLLAATAQATAATPTVIVDIHAIGPARLAELKSQPDVRWSAEFGNELLLGVDAPRLQHWLKRDDTRIGLGELDASEIWIRDHACSHQQASQPALGSVGGYELLRMPASLVRYARSVDASGSPLPADGVQSREAANQSGLKTAGAADPQIEQIVARVDAERWFATLSELAGFNRSSFSPTLSSARDWILTQLQTVGLGTETFAFNFANVSGCGSPPPPALTLTNPLGRKLGSSLPDEWIVVGAHYDSRNSVRCDGVSAAQPGANDNASGCAGVIELARVFQHVQTQRSILFMCFAGEEQGLVGSREYVAALQANGDIAKVKHMMNLDMLGFDAGGALDARVESNTANASLLAEYRAAAVVYAPELNLITSTNAGANSDHWYFLNAGVPSVFTWENGASNYPHYHQSTDIPANMTNARPLAGAILKMDAAMLAQKAGLVPPLFADGFE